MNTDDAAAADETTSELRMAPRGRGGVWARRAGIMLLAAIVLAAALGALGPRTAEKTEASDGYTLSLVHPQISRAGQPAPLSIRVESENGFNKAVQLSLCTEFFDDLDFQAWYPTPSAETTLPRSLVYEFDPPPSGDILEIHLDARIAPGQFGESDDCTVSVLEDDQPMVSAKFTTWRMP